MKTTGNAGRKGNDKQEINRKNNDSSCAKIGLSTQLEFPWYFSENQFRKPKMKETTELQTSSSNVQAQITGSEIETGITTDLETIAVKNDLVLNSDEQIIDDCIGADEPDLISLPEHFQGNGEVEPYYFSLVSKTDKGFCYEVSLDGRITHYETFQRKINKRFGNISYPGSNSFGIWAWTFSKKEDALKKLQTL